MLGAAAVCGFVIVIFTSVSGLPECNSSAAKKSVDDALANAPFGKVMGLSIIEIASARETGKSTNRIECDGMATLNTGANRKVVYSFEIRNETVWVQAQVLLAE